MVLVQKTIHEVDYYVFSVFFYKVFLHTESIDALVAIACKIARCLARYGGEAKGIVSVADTEGRFPRMDAVERKDFDKVITELHSIVQHTIELGSVYEGSDDT